jgi:hypothetical protein
MWNYRILRHREKGCVWFAVHEVYYDDKNRAWGYTQEPVAAKAETKDETVACLRMMLKDCLFSPALDAKKIPEKGAVAPGASIMKKHKKSQSK